MSFEAGGRADKLGNRYEEMWIARQMLLLLEEKIRSITIEAIGDDEQGVDFWIETCDGKRQAHQCKARNASKEYWTIGIFDQKGIIKNIAKQLNRDNNFEFHFISPIPFTQLDDICCSARNSDDNPREFYTKQIKRSKETEKIFNKICETLSLNINSDEDIDKCKNILKRTYINLFPDDENSRQDNVYSVNRLLTGDERSNLLLIKNYAIESNKLGQAILTIDLYKYLKDRNVHPRILSYDNRIVPQFTRLNTDFKESFSSLLINGQILERDECSECLSALENNSIIFIHGKSGSGKTGVIYELVEKLSENNVPYLCLRVDRQIPEYNTIKYGQNLGLPASPVHCLNAIANKGLSVLIIDQLDALRWTVAKSGDSLSVCKSLLEEIIGWVQSGSKNKVIVSCRTFDLKNDIEISKWIERKKNDNKEIGIKEIEIKPLELKEEKIKLLIGSNYNNLTIKQKILLRNPQILYIFVELYKTSKFDFKSSTDLIKKYWEEKKKEIEKKGVSNDHINNIICCIFKWVENEGKISVPWHYLTSKFSENILNIFCSCGIFQLHSEIVNFCHQSYLDFLIAAELVNQIYDGNNILQWLGPKEAQTLWRREQLRHALTLLMEDNSSYFLKSVKLIIESNDVRFHLKHLALEIIGMIDDIDFDTEKYVFELLSSKLRSHLIETVFLGNEKYIRLLIKSGTLKEWLESNDEKLIEEALWLLRSVSKIIPDEVTLLIVPFADNDGKWSESLFYTLSNNPSDDSDSMFDLRIKLLNKIEIIDWFCWQELSIKHPLRVLKLIEILFNIKYKLNSNESSELHNFKLRCENWNVEGFNNIIQIPRKFPSETWAIVSPIVNKILEQVTQEYYLEDLFKQKYIFEGLAIHLMVQAGKVLALKEPEKFIDQIKKLSVNSNYVTQKIIADTIIDLPLDYANFVIDLFCENDYMFLLNDSEIEHRYEPACKIIRKFSNFSSEILFKKLENKIIHFHTPYEKEHAIQSLKARREGCFNDYFWGEAQYLLLNELINACEFRVSTYAKNVFKPLQRKHFNDRFGPLKVYGGVVHSKLDKNLLKISDKAWLKIIENKKISEHSNNHIQDGPNSLAVSDIRSNSCSLKLIASYYPERFGRLALKLSNNTNMAYVSKIFDAMSLTNAENSFPDEVKKNWAPASINTVINLIYHFKSNKPEFYHSLCWLISKRANEDWPIDILNIIIETASNHPEPLISSSNEYFNISSYELCNKSINCIRGIAIDAIGKLLYNHHEIYDAIASLIEKIIKNEHPFVQIAVPKILLPILNIDEKKAVKWFCELSKIDIKYALSHYGITFIKYVVHKYSSEIGGIIKNALYSVDENICRTGANLLSAYNIFYDLYSEEMKKCFSGSINQKVGVISSAVKHIGDVELSKKCREIIKQFFDNEEDEIKNEISNIFIHNAHSLKDNIPFIKRYLHSKSFTDPFMLLHALKENCQNLIEFSELLFSLCDVLSNNCGKDNNDYNAEIISELLLKLYDQSQSNNKEIMLKCLDSWDILFEKRIGIARQLTKKIE